MTETERLNAAIARLAGDSESDRLKKLLLCLCRQRWENDIEQLKAVEWGTLAIEIRTTFPTRHQLRDAAIEVVSRINKKSLYFPLAVRAIAILDDLYPQPREFSSIVETGIYSLAEPLSSVSSSDLWFDLRSSLSQTANLSEAKTLLYSAIHGKFAYTIQDWNHLNHEEFDSLARSLLDRCSSASELAFRLYGAANCLEPPQHYERIAQVLYRSLKKVYETWQPWVDSSPDEDTDTTDPTSVTSSTTSTPLSTGLNLREGDENDRTQLGVGLEVEATLHATTSHHVQAAINAIEQQAKALVEDIQNLVVNTDPETAKAIEDRCLQEFSATLQQFYRQLDRPTQP